MDRRTEQVSAISSNRAVGRKITLARRLPENRGVVGFRRRTTVAAVVAAALCVPAEAAFAYNQEISDVDTTVAVGTSVDVYEVTSEIAAEYWGNITRYKCYEIGAVAEPCMPQLPDILKDATSFYVPIDRTADNSPGIPLALLSSLPILLGPSNAPAMCLGADLACEPFILTADGIDGTYAGAQEERATGPSGQVLDVHIWESAVRWVYGYVTCYSNGECAWDVHGEVETYIQLRIEGTVTRLKMRTQRTAGNWLDFVFAAGICRTSYGRNDPCSGGNQGNGTFYWSSTSNGLDKNVGGAGQQPSRADYFWKYAHGWREGGDYWEPPGQYQNGGYDSSIYSCAVDEDGYLRCEFET